MALPQKIQVNAITGASLPSTIDGDLNAGIKQPLIDIFGIPDNTNISAALLSVDATGLTAVVFRDAAGNPATAGHLQRNGTLLNFYDGAANRILVSRDLAETLTNKTLTAPIISTITNTGTVTLFTATDTVVGRATTDTLTNKTITAPVLSGTATGTYTLGGTPTITTPTITGGTLTQVPITQNSQSTAYTTLLTDGGKHLLHPTADNNPRTFTIDSNANVAYPTGTVITFVNQINVLSIAITADTLTLAGAGTTGTRTLAASGVATAIKLSSTGWLISGVGLA